MDKAEHLRIGQLGENIACRYLISRGYLVRDRNYRKKYGEIDIVALKAGRVHFVEVKSVSRENYEKKVTYATKNAQKPIKDDYEASDNVHPWKLRRLAHTIEAYLLERFADEEPDWQLDVLLVTLFKKDRKARVEILEDVDL